MKISVFPKISLRAQLVFGSAILITLFSCSDGKMGWESTSGGIASTGDSSTTKNGLTISSEGMTSSLDLKVSGSDVIEVKFTLSGDVPVEEINVFRVFDFVEVRAKNGVLTEEDGIPAPKRANIGGLDTTLNGDPVTPEAPITEEEIFQYSYTTEILPPVRPISHRVVAFYEDAENSEPTHDLEECQAAGLCFDVKYDFYPISEDGNNKLQLVWEQPKKQNFSHFRVFKQLLPFEWHIKNLEKNAASYTQKSLAPGQSYKFKISALGVDGSTEYFVTDEVDVPLFCGNVTGEYLQQIGGRGNGKADNPYRICSAEDYYTLTISEGFWRKHFVLTNDIDLSLLDADKKVKPIGNLSDPFTGSFSGQLIVNGVLYNKNGKDFAIQNLNIEAEGECIDAERGPEWFRHPSSMTGMFGYVLGGRIENLRLESPVVMGCGMTGALVGFGVYGRDPKINSTIDNHFLISNVHVKNPTVTGRADVGGLVGRVGNRLSGKNVSRIIKSSVRADSLDEVHVSGEARLGGIVGTFTSGQILQTVSTVNVYGPGGQLGGFIGVVVPALGRVAEIRDSYALGTVAAPTENGDRPRAGFIGVVSPALSENEGKSVYLSRVFTSQRYFLWNVANNPDLQRGPSGMSLENSFCLVSSGNPRPIDEASSVLFRASAVDLNDAFSTIPAVGDLWSFPTVGFPTLNYEL
jgi:hypothetical protein